MTKNEFLTKLQEALENDLDSFEVRENLDYYRSYIEEQIANGSSEESVLGELGDPWVIAQSVISMSENRLTAEETAGYGQGRSGAYRSRAGSSGTDYGRDGDGFDPRQMHIYRIDSWWKSLLVILAVLAILVLIAVVVGGLLRFLAPVLIPVLLIVMIIRLFRGR